MSLKKFFTPTKRQRLAKARLHRAVAERDFALDLESMTIEQMEQLAGTKLRDWFSDPQVAAWFVDSDLDALRVQAYRELAVEKLYEILTAPLEARVLTAKDQLVAAKELLTLADAYPAKNTKYVYVDKQIAAMDESDTDKAIAETKKKLRLTGKVGGGTDGKS